MREAADDGTGDAGAHPDRGVTRDAKQLIEKHQPAGKAQHERNQRPHDAGGHRGSAAAGAARACTRPTGDATATTCADLNGLGQYAAIRLARTRDRYRLVVLQV
jgi:hypothetical protein